jgi:hypothetical protein
VFRKLTLVANVVPVQGVENFKGFFGEIHIERQESGDL